MSAPGTFTIAFYCLCGATMKASGVGSPATAAELPRIFWGVHQGVGHGGTDARTAGKARRRLSHIASDVPRETTSRVKPNPAR